MNVTGFHGCIRVFQDHSRGVPGVCRVVPNGMGNFKSCRGHSREFQEVSEEVSDDFTEYSRELRISGGFNTF